MQEGLFGFGRGEGVGGVCGVGVDGAQGVETVEEGGQERGEAFDGGEGGVEFCEGVLFFFFG